MIREELFAPKRIVVAGGSEQRSKPGGKLLQNLLEGVLVQKMAEGMELFIGALVHFTALCHGDKRAGFESTDW